jgi:hypothetical protein
VCHHQRAVELTEPHRLALFGGRAASASHWPGEIACTRHRLPSVNNRGAMIVRVATTPGNAESRWMT